MLKRVKKYWSDLKSGKPGSRFQEQYDENREEQKSPIGRALRIIVGLILIPVGMFFLAVPGPGLLIIGLGAVMIAREFRFAAKALDHFEVWARSVYKRLSRLWRRLVTARRQVTR